jgi:hypothetical protein
MRTVRNITVCVSPELYRQTKLLAAKYDTTVSGVVAYLLERLPDALERARYPVGGTKRKSSASMSSVGGIKQQSSASMSSFAPASVPASQSLESPQVIDDKELPSAVPGDSFSL